MAKHNELGKQGEKLAGNWLEKNGYEIIHRNWRYGKGEIDIIARKIRCDDNLVQREFLHFIEVKTRNHSSVGNPEDNVTRKKFKKLQWVAGEYLFRNPGIKWIQYDILSITTHPDKDPDYFLLADVFL